MTIEVTFRGGIELTMEVSDKYKVLSRMMYSDKRADTDYDNQYYNLVNQCIEEICNNYKINFSKFLNIPNPDTCITAIIDKSTSEEMMVDDWD